jgi:hypothetical protein
MHANINSKSIAYKSGRHTVGRGRWSGRSGKAAVRAVRDKGGGGGCDWSGKVVAATGSQLARVRSDGFGIESVKSGGVTIKTTLREIIQVCGIRGTLKIM